jgi:hypothetical protein
MGIKVEEGLDNLNIMRITGLIKKPELDTVQAAMAKKLVDNPQLRIKLLIIVEDFKGWEGNVDWGDMSFYIEHGDKIDKIALVADPKREKELMMFLGAGIRPTPLKYFPPEQIDQARVWLL